MFMSPGNLITHRQNDERKVERFKNRLTSLRDKFITIFDNAINDEKKAMSFFKRKLKRPWTT